MARRSGFPMFLCSIYQRIWGVFEGPLWFTWGTAEFHPCLVGVHLCVTGEISRRGSLLTISALFIKKSPRRFQNTQERTVSESLVTLHLRTHDAWHAVVLKRWQHLTFGLGWYLTAFDR
ncbi:UNVERIFIED_CONTAM: hypothetical protein K2H54_003574 [Gekko kuhli]